MSYDDEDRMRIRESRGMIVQITANAAPCGVDVEGDLVAPLCNPDLPRPQKRDWVLKDVALLDELGLIRTPVEDIGGRRRRRAYATARGLDFFQANMPWARVMEFTG